MFRQLSRQKQALTPQECQQLLMHEKRGVLCVNGDDGYPYGMPMNHLYCPEEGCLYFHCGKKGHRLDALHRSAKASFCVCEQGTATPGDWALQVRSVVAFGRVEVIAQENMVVEVTARLSRKFTSDEEYIRREILQSGKDTLLLKFTVEHLCGKRVREA